MEETRVQQENLSLRPAAMEDAAFLLALRNDPLVRQWSFHHEKISQEDHRRWFAGVLADENRRLSILMAGDRPAGQVRIDLDGAGTAEISYSLAAPFRGQGLGNRMIALLIEEVTKKNPEITALTAEVLPDNTASCRVFERNGFACIDRTQKCLTYRRKIERERKRQDD